jgi:hypothetical protein
MNLCSVAISWSEEIKPTVSKGIRHIFAKVNSHGTSVPDPHERDKPDPVPNLLQCKQTEALKAHNRAIQEQENHKI